MTEQHYQTQPSRQLEPPHDPDTRALPLLFERGGHFVLTPARSKLPIWPAWQLRRPPLDVVMAHHGGLGIIPWSLRTTALDVDKMIGNGLAVLIECTGPLATIDTPRGYHCYFRDHEPRDNANWAGFGCSGQVRGANGYLRLYPGGAAKLASALATIPEDAGLWPADLFAAAGVVVEEKLPAAGSFSLAEIPPLSAPETVQIGFRNVAVFNHTRFWAYGADRGGRLAAWVDRCQAMAASINARFPRPLAAREVETTAYSIATWVWSGGGPLDHRPVAQSRRGTKSGKVRRGLASGRTVHKPEIAARDVRIVHAVTVEGRPLRAVAREHDLDESTVRHIVARDAPLFASVDTDTLTSARPWEVEGVSRATWFRRRQTPTTKLNNGP